MGYCIFPYLGLGGRYLGKRIRRVRSAIVDIYGSEQLTKSIPLWSLYKYTVITPPPPKKKKQKKQQQQKTWSNYGEACLSRILLGGGGGGWWLYFSSNGFFWGSWVVPHPRRGTVGLLDLKSTMLLASSRVSRRSPKGSLPSILGAPSEDPTP